MSATNLSELRLGQVVAFVDILGFGGLTTDPMDIPVAVHHLLDLNEGIDRLCQLKRFQAVKAYGFLDCAFIVFDRFEDAVLFCSTLYQFCASRKARIRGAIAPGEAYDLREHVQKTFHAPNFSPSPVCGTAFTMAAKLESGLLQKGFWLFAITPNPSVPGSAVMEFLRPLPGPFAKQPPHPEHMYEVMWPANYSAHVVEELNLSVGGVAVAPYDEIYARMRADRERWNGSGNQVAVESAVATLEVFQYWEEKIRPKGILPATFR